MTSQGKRKQYSLELPLIVAAFSSVAIRLVPPKWSHSPVRLCGVWFLPLHSPVPSKTRSLCKWRHSLEKTKDSPKVSKVHWSCLSKLYSLVNGNVSFWLQFYRHFPGDIELSLCSLIQSIKRLEWERERERRERLGKTGPLHFGKMDLLFKHLEENPLSQQSLTLRNSSWIRKIRKLRVILGVSIKYNSVRRTHICVLTCEQ